MSAGKQPQVGVPEQPAGTLAQVVVGEQLENGAQPKPPPSTVQKVPRQQLATQSDGIGLQMPLGLHAG